MNDRIQVLQVTNPMNPFVRINSVKQTMSAGTKNKHLLAKTRRLQRVMTNLSNDNECFIADNIAKDICFFVLSSEKQVSSSTSATNNPVNETFRLDAVTKIDDYTIPVSSSFFLTTKPKMFQTEVSADTSDKLRVAKLEKDVSKHNKIDLYTESLAALKTQVPFVVDNYLGSKVRDVFQKELKKHTDENAMDKGVANTVQDHKRRHDDDDDDDEDPSARPNHGKKIKRRRTKESESSKNPSTSKETPKGKASSSGFKTGKSASVMEPVKEPIAEVVMDDAGNDVVRDDDQLQDSSEPKKTVSNPISLSLHHLNKKNRKEI
ncbi:hypothetical protein Tco_1262230 [Tanacetum coccineum]